MKKFLLLALFLISKVALADAPLIWGNNDQAEFLVNGWYLGSGEQYFSSSVDPSAGGGVPAQIGSIITRNNAGVGELWVKGGAGNTAWTNVLTGNSGWSLAGNAGTGGTAILGTTDAQNFGIRANNAQIMNFKSAYPGFDTGVTQVPADGVGINQFDFRVFVSPSASTTNASHTGTYSQLVYDNGNTGFDSTGGSYFASSANFTNNGSGDLGAASIFSGGASFNNAGTTGQFKGVTSESIIDTGATVTDFQGMTSGLNTTGGIVPASNSLSLYGNFTDATIGNASNISSNLSFSGTTANSQGVNAISSFTQFNDSATTTNGVNGINAGIDLNDTAAVTGVNASNVYVNMRDTATHGGLSLYNAGLNQQDSAVNTGGVNGFSANLQFTNTSDTAGVTLFNGYARTDDTAHLDSLTGIQINPEIQGSSDVDNVNIADFSGQIRGSSTVDNLTGVNVGPQMSGSATVTNFMGINVNPQVNGTSVLTNSLTGIQVSPSSVADINTATGVNVNMSGVTLSAASLAAGNKKVGIANDGAFETGYNYTVPGAAGFFQINYMGGGPIVAAGDPTSAFGFGNNLAHSVTLHDDWNLDGSGLGFVDVGFVGSLSFDAGTTMAQWTGALGGAGNPAGSGTLTTAKMFSAAGILPQGGSLAVTNMYGFEVNPNLFCLVGTNCWGFYEDTASAENHMSKLAIGTASKKVVNSSTALEIGNSKGFVNGRGDTATKSALTAVAGMQFYDTDLDKLQWYNGTTWVDASGSAGTSPLTTKGDLFTYDTADARLPVGTNGQVLSANSAQATGLEWVTPTDTGITELTGDVTAGPGNGSQAATIANSAVTNAKMANMANNTIKSNISGGAAAPSDNSLSAIIDSAVSNTQGSILYRNATDWVALAPGTSGDFLQTQGAGANPQWATASGGSSTLAVATKSANYTMTNADDVILCDTSSGAVTITMQSSASATSKEYKVKSIGDNACTIALAGGDTIDGDTNLVLTVKNTAIGIIPDGGTAWHVF